MDTVRFKRDARLASMVADWEFFENTYNGGTMYAKANLIRHEREPDIAFSRRLKEACVINYCAPVVDLYNFYLYRTDPMRDLGSLSDSPLMQRFVDDADFMGNRYQDVIRAISERGSIYGIFGVVVDKPQGVTESMGEELANDIRPYVATYAPENIWCMDYERVNGGRPKLVKLILEEDSNRLRVWTVDSVLVYGRVAGTIDEYELEQEIINPLGIIPFVLHTNRMALDPMCAASDIADLAHIQRSVFNNDSKMLEAMGRAAFPMMEIPDGSLPMPSGNQFSGEIRNQEIVVGSGNALIRSSGDSVGHRYIEPSMVGASRYLEIRKAMLDDFSIIARTQHANAQKTVATSGVALEIEFQQLNGLLSSKAACMERTEVRLLQLVANWLGTEFNGSIKYNDSFGVKDLSADIDTAIKSLSVITSPTYKAEIAKQLATRILDDDTERAVFDLIGLELTTPSTIELLTAA